MNGYTTGERVLLAVVGLYLLALFLRPVVFCVLCAMDSIAT